MVFSGDAEDEWFHDAVEESIRFHIDIQNTVVIRSVIGYRDVQENRWALCHYGRGSKPKVGWFQDDAIFADLSPYWHNAVNLDDQLPTINMVAKTSLFDASTRQIHANASQIIEPQYAVYEKPSLDIANKEVVFGKLFS